MNVDDDDEFMSSLSSMVKHLQAAKNATTTTTTTSTLTTKSTKYGELRELVEPAILFSGILFNLTLMLITLRKKRTKSLRTTKPLRYLLIGMLVSDTWFLIYHVNVWYYFIHNKPDLSSLDILCQLYTYFNYFFAILLECNMLAADWILLHIVFKSAARATERSRCRERGISVYDQFRVNDAKSSQQGGGGGGLLGDDMMNRTNSRTKSIGGRLARLSLFLPFGIERSKSVPAAMMRVDKSIMSELHDCSAGPADNGNVLNENEISHAANPSCSNYSCKISLTNF